MDLSDFTGIMTIVAGINIFYAMYGVMENNWINFWIPIFNFFILIFSATWIEDSLEQLRIKLYARTEK
jgi:hypothetical protein